LHLVGILFPHINDDSRSKSHQSCEGSRLTTRPSASVQAGNLHSLFLYSDPPPLGPAPS